MDMHDKMLATAVAQGDRAAFATPVARHCDRDHGLALCRTGANTLLRLAESLGR